MSAEDNNAALERALRVAAKAALEGGDHAACVDILRVWPVPTSGTHCFLRTVALEASDAQACANVLSLLTDDGLTPHCTATIAAGLAEDIARLVTAAADDMVVCVGWSDAQRRERDVAKAVKRMNGLIELLAYFTSVVATNTQPRGALESEVPPCRS